MKKYGEHQYQFSFIGTDEDPSLRIESFAIKKLLCVSTKLNWYNICLFTFIKKPVFQLNSIVAKRIYFIVSWIPNDTFTTWT